MATRNIFVYHKREGIGHEDRAVDDAHAPVYVEGRHSNSIAALGYPIPPPGDDQHARAASSSRISKLDALPALLVASGGIPYPANAAELGEGGKELSRLRIRFLLLVLVNTVVTLVLARSAWQDAVGVNGDDASAIFDPDPAFPNFPLWCRPGTIVTRGEWDAVLLVGQPRHKVRNIPVVTMSTTAIALQLVITLAVLCLGAAAVFRAHPVGITVFMIFLTVWDVSRVLGGGLLGSVPLGSTGLAAFTVDPGGSPSFTYMCRLALDALCVFLAARFRACLLPSWVWNWRERAADW